MPSPFENASSTPAIPITFATKSTWEALAAALPAQARQFARANGFSGKPGACLTLPAADGAIAQVLFGIEDEAAKSRDLFRPGALPGLLPAGTYRFANAPHDVRLAALAFAQVVPEMEAHRHNLVSWRNALHQKDAWYGSPEAVRIAIRPIPGDQLSAIGPMPRTSGYYIAVTHSGVTMSPFLGAVVADEIVGGRQRAELADFRPARFFN